MAGTIDRDSILAAARQIVERDGVESLTMRGLANAMGTKPMTLYYHVPNKEALLAALLDRAAADIPWTVATGTPRDRMIAIVGQMVDRLREIDWIVATLQAGTHVGAPALTLQNQFVDAAYELGASPQQAMDTWRACWYLVASELIWRRDTRTHQADQDVWHQTIDPATLEEFPTVQKLLPDMPELSRNFDLAAAIRHQIDGAIADFGTAH